VIRARLILLLLLPCTCFSVPPLFLFPPCEFCCCTSVCQTQSHRLVACNRLQKSDKKTEQAMAAHPPQVLIALERQSKCLLNVLYTSISSAALPIITEEQFIKRTPPVKKPSVSFDCQSEKTENTSEKALSSAPYYLNHKRIPVGDMGTAGILPVALNLFPIGTHSADCHSVAQSFTGKEGKGCHSRAWLWII